MNWLKRREKTRKWDKFFEEWRRRTNFDNIHIGSANEVIESYYFANMLINNLIYSYPSAIHFNGCKMEKAKHLLANFVLWYLYAVKMPILDCEKFQFGKPSLSSVASCMTLLVTVTGGDYNYDTNKFDKEYIEPVPFTKAFHELAITPLLEFMDNKENLLREYSNKGYADIIEYLPDVHPYLYKFFISYTFCNKAEVTELIHICIMALHKAEYSGLYYPWERR